MSLGDSLTSLSGSRTIARVSFFAGLFLGRRRRRSALVLGAFAVAVAAGSGACGLDARGTQSGQIGAASSSGSGGGGGAGGTGGSEVLLCFPLAAVPCYDGPEETEGVGVCRGGQRMCAPDGKSYGECVGQVVPTPENCVSVEDEDCDEQSVACTGETVWARAMGGTNFDTAVAVAVDPSKNVIVTGFYRGTASFGGQSATSVGDGDIFVAKYSSTGGFLWSRSFGGPEMDVGLAVATDADGYIFVAGSYRNTINFGYGPFKSGGGDDLFIVKLDPLGNVVYAKHFGEDGDQYPSGIALAPDGGLVVVGGFTGSVGFDPGAPTLTSAGSYDIFVAKFDRDCRYEWGHQYGDVNQQAAGGVATSANGRVIVVGQASGTFNVGAFELKNSGYDVFAAGFTSDGGSLYARSFGDFAEQGAYGVAADPQGGAIVAGDFQGKLMFDKELSADAFDSFVVSLSPSGDPLWSRSLGGAGDQKARGVARDPFGDILVTGTSFTSLAFDTGPLASVTRDVFVAKLKPSGEGVWARLIGDDLSWEQYGLDIAADAEGSVLIVGEFDSGMSFDIPPILSAGSRDAFIAKLSP